jgi:cell division protease FtsH
MNRRFTPGGPVKGPPADPRTPKGPGAPFRISLWHVLLIAWLALLAFQFVSRSATPSVELSYSELRQEIRDNRVKEVRIGATQIAGTLRGEPPKNATSTGTATPHAAPPTASAPAVASTPRAGTSSTGETAFKTVRVEDPDLLRELEAHHVKVTGVEESSFWSDLLPTIVLVLLFAGVWGFALRRMRETQGGFMTVGKSKAKVYMEKDVKVSFDDVAGVDEAKDELSEVVEYLRRPEKFTRLGGKIPKGILLVGPPGTGKTLLAKAVAGEAGVPFFYISGSDFVEMFVGVGAARVRDLFIQAKSKAPCIIFIDELDALGKARGMGPMAHEEREQTLNQLLVELDGFDSRTGVILMAATNRPEILDPALLRAGRFDRHVLVDRPDKAGRLAILKIHSRGVPLEDPAALEPIAGMTVGFAGADLANLINEAALLAVRRSHDLVTRGDLEEAVERVIAGLEKKNRALNRRERERVAHHEVGHALVALAIPGADPVHKISIIPRGIAALGYTMQLPTEDRFLLTRSELLSRIAVLLGGRVAEELVYGEISTGARDDIQKATDVASSMVRAYGMSETIGQVSLERDSRPVLGPPLPNQGGPEYSEQTAREVDTEVRRIIDEQYQRTRELLTLRQHALKEAAKVLLEKESISGEELQAIVKGRTEAA